MSNYARSLATRAEFLESAKGDLSDALADDYLDTQHERAIREAKEAVDNVLTLTDDELDVLNADWQLVEGRADHILQQLHEVALLMDGADLVNYDEEGYQLAAALDDEPSALADTRRYINDALTDWYEVRDTASNVLDERNSGPTGGYER